MQSYILEPFRFILRNVRYLRSIDFYDVVAINMHHYVEIYNIDPEIFNIYNYTPKINSSENLTADEMGTLTIMFDFNVEYYGGDNFSDV